MLNLCLLPVAAIMVAACSDSGSGGVPLPTQTLRPLPPSATPLPPTVTPTLPVRIRPADLVTPTPADPAAELRQLVQADAAQRLSLAPEQVEVMIVNPASWADADTLDCTIDDDQLQTGRVQGYEMIVVARRDVLIYHTDTGETLRLCSQATVETVPGEVLVQVDPVALEVFTLLRQQVAADLDIATRQVRMMEMRAITWPDTSLGCPDPQYDYAQMTVPGYRLVLGAGDTEYIFHTDIARVVPCEPEDVVLPSGDDTN